MKQMSLRKKLLAGGAALTIIPMLVLGAITIFSTTQTVKGFAEDTTMRATEKLAGQVQEFIQREVVQAKALSALTSLNVALTKVDRDGRESAKEEIESLNREILGIVKQLGEQYTGIFITDRNGASFAGAKSDGDMKSYKSMNVSDRDYFKAARQDGKPGVGSLVKSKVTNKPVMVTYVPLKSEKGEFSGLLAVISDCSFLNKMVAGTKFGKTGYAFLLDDSGVVIAHHDEKLILEAKIAEIPGMEKISKAVIAQQKGIEYYTFQGVDKLASFAPAGVKSWSIIASQAKDEIMAVPTELRNRTVLAGSILLCLSLVLVYFFGRSVSRPIARVVEGLADSAEQAASASMQLSSASSSLAEGASEQAASLEETSSSLEEMSSTTKQNAENANQANKLMAETRGTVSRASQAMGDLIVSMAEISRASEETSKIIKTIDEIAFQTNLLALNAAVEAARAGEAGAGFAVVADEVRNLAMRAAEAAGNTANLIEGTVKRVKEGSALVEKTNNEFQAVAAGVGKSGDLVGEISAASLEQAQGIEQVNRAVNEMDSVVQHNASSAEQSASASEVMSAQAERMKDFVGELVAMVGAVNVNRAGDKAAPAGVGKENAPAGAGKEENAPVRTARVSLPKHTNGNGKANGKEYAQPSRKALEAERAFPLDEDTTDF